MTIFTLVGLIAALLIGFAHWTILLQTGTSWPAFAAAWLGATLQVVWCRGVADQLGYSVSSLKWTDAWSEEAAKLAEPYRVSALVKHAVFIGLLVMVIGCSACLVKVHWLAQLGCGGLALAVADRIVSVFERHTERSFRQALSKRG